MRLLAQLQHHARRQGQAVAVQQIGAADGASLRFDGLWQQVLQVSQALQDRLPAGSAVLLCSANRPAYLAGFLGVLQAGMTVFPVAPDLAGPELLTAAQRSNASAMVTIDFANHPLAGEFSQTQTFDALGQRATLLTGPKWTPRADLGTSMLLLSSGTMGKPKIVRRDAAALDAVSENMARAVGFTPGDRVLAAVPLCHSYGVEHGLLAPIWAGSTVHLCDGFDLPACVRELSAGGITIFPGVPFMFEMLCDSGEPGARFPSLRRAYSAGGPLPRGVYEAFIAKFRIPVSQLYGASEVGSVTYNDPTIAPFDPASVGRGMNGVDIRILDPADSRVDRPRRIGQEGHVAIGAPSRMSGYLDGETSPIVDGFFLTGDLGRLDASGALAITGRIKLLIDVGGRKVNPLEVEQVIESHPAVGACVVVPMPVSQTLFRLKAIVTPAREGVVPDARKLREWARKQLSAYKVPRVFEVRASLPRSSTGKLLRHLADIG